MAGISSKALSFGGPENKKKYNGIEFENDLELNVYDAELRELDQQVGRWWQIDPVTDGYESISPYASMYNNPLTYSDPVGDEGEECCRDFLNAIGNAVEDVLISASGVVNGTLNTVSFGLVSSDPFGMRNKLSGEKLELYNNSVTVGKLGPSLMPGVSSTKTPPLELVPASGGSPIPVSLKTTPLTPVLPSTLQSSSTSSGSNSSSGKGMQNPKVKEAVNQGKAQHDALKQKVNDKPGWKSEPVKKDNSTGSTLKPDVETPSGNLLELKPKTNSGTKKGATQQKKYEQGTGQKTRVIYYDPKKTK